MQHKSAIESIKNYILLHLNSQSVSQVRQAVKTVSVVTSVIPWTKCAQ